METTKKCLRPGCGKTYNESENVEGVCVYHDGKPIFHDIKKGWTCCNQVVYDWDQFTQLKGCKVDKHSDVKPNTTDFFKSQTVNNAQKGIDSNSASNTTTNTTTQPTTQVKSIDEYEREQVFSIN